MNTLKIEYISLTEVKLAPAQLVERIVPHLNKVILLFMKKFETKWHKGQFYVIPAHGVKVLEKAIQSLNQKSVLDKV